MTLSADMRDSEVELTHDKAGVWRVPAAAQFSNGKKAHELQIGDVVMAEGGKLECMIVCIRKGVNVK